MGQRYCKFRVFIKGQPAKRHQIRTKTGNVVSTTVAFSASTPKLIIDRVWNRWVSLSINFLQTVVLRQLLNDLGYATKSCTSVISLGRNGLHSSIRLFDELRAI